MQNLKTRKRWSLTGKTLYSTWTGKKIEGDLFDSSKMKVVSYNENSHVQILAVCAPYGPPFYVRRDIDGLLWSSWVKIEEEHFWQEINGCAAAIKFPPLCTSHYYF